MTAADGQPRPGGRAGRRKARSSRSFPGCRAPAAATA